MPFLATVRQQRWGKDGRAFAIAMADAVICDAVQALFTQSARMKLARWRFVSAMAPRINVELTFGPVVLRPAVGRLIHPHTGELR
jgi:hypothetical protein